MAGRRDRPAIAPKRQEIGRFEGLIDGLVGLSKSEETFLKNAEVIVKEVDSIEADANVKLRFNNHLKYIDDYSIEQMEKDLATIEVTRSKLRNEYVDDEEIESMTFPQLKEYAKGVKMPDISKHKRKPELFAALLEHLSARDDDK